MNVSERMSPRQRQRLIALAILTTVFSLGHHVDHIIRGNHVGWPMTANVTPFTYSFGFYPFIALGLYLLMRGRTVPLFWSILTGAGFLFVGLAHFGPFAVEPPRDILSPYSSNVIGYFAVLWLIAFLIVLATTCVYGTRLWWRQRRAGGP